MARAGMANLIKRIRAMTNTGATDETINSVAYWTDDQIQSELDHNRVFLYNQPLHAIQVMTTGVFQWLRYILPPDFPKAFEEASTTGQFVVKDYSGNIINASGYTINYDDGSITFTADQAGAEYTLDVSFYDINRTAAEIWRQKAAYIAAKVDFKTETRDIKASQEYDHCMKMVQFFNKKSGIIATRFKRTDENPDRSHSVLFGQDVQLSNFRPSRSDIYE